MEQLSYKLEVFEGPLDLLLTLLAKNKVSIFEVSISLLLEQYMAQIERMQDNDMEVASEFLEMAARLVQIKTASLLPRKDEEQELRQELAGQLVEYEACKRTALVLGERMSFDRFVREPMVLPKKTIFEGKIEPQALLEALTAAGGHARPAGPEKEDFSPLISAPVVSVSSQIVAVLRRLWKAGKASYHQLFKEKRTRSERVAAFLALLELIKGKRVRVEGNPEDPTLVLQKGGRQWKSGM